MELKQRKLVAFWVNSVNLIIAMILLIIISTFLPRYRLDLTKNKIHSLSPATITMVKSLNDVVNIKVYLTAELPPQAKTLADDLKTILNEYHDLNKSNLVVKYFDPNKDSTAKGEALKYGIQPLQFSSVKSDKLEVQSGYFGLALIYGNNQEVLPVAGDVGNLEYFLDSGIKKLTSKKSKEAVWATGNGEVDNSQIQIFNKYLGDNYQVSQVDLSKDESLQNKNGILILAGPTTVFSPKAVNEISQWLAEKKATLLLADSVNVDGNLKGTITPTLGIEEVLKNYGISLDNKLVLDSSSSIASFRTQSGSFMTQYPFWVQIQATNINQNLPLLSGIQTLLFPWPSPLVADGKAKVMIYSSPKSWTSSDMNELSPVSKWQANGDLSKRALAAINTEDTRLAVVGNVNFIKDQFAANNQENLVLAFNMVDYLLQDDSLLSIRSKTIQYPPLTLVGDQTKTIIKYGGIILPIVLLSLIGGLMFIIRRHNNQKLYD